MTRMYERQGPVSFQAAPFEAASLHASHSVVQDPDYISPQKAKEDALALAAEMGSPVELCIDAFSLPFRHRSPSKSVRFCEEVHVLSGLDEDFDAGPQVFQHDVLRSWPDKPWRMTTSPGVSPQEHATSGNSDGQSPVGSAGPEAHQAAPPETMTSLEPPLWHHPIQALLDEEGAPDEDQDDFVIFVSSFFIDHQIHQYHDEPRVLRFANDPAQWEEDVRFVWEDLADAGEDIDILLIRPPPPFFPFRGTVGIAIVQQRPQPDRAACLLSAVLPLSPDFRVFQTAHSLSPAVPFQTILNLAGVAIPCQQRASAGFGDCTVYVGNDVLATDRDLLTSPGLGVLIHVPPMMSDADFEHNFVLQLHHADHAPEHTGTMAPEDAVSLMARRPQPKPRQRRQPSSPSSSSSTSDTSYSTESSEPHDLVLRHAVVFPLSGQPQSLWLPWNHGRQMYQLIAEAFRINYADVRDAHFVESTPKDLVDQRLQCLLLQRSFEPRPSDDMRIVLIDIDVFENHDLQPAAFRRVTQWMPHTINRASVFRLLGLAEILTRYDDRVRLWLNHILIDDHNTLPFYLQDGDYLKLLAEEQECPSGDSQTDDDMEALDPVIASILQDHSSLLQQAPKLERPLGPHRPSLLLRQHAVRHNSGAFSNIAAYRRFPQERLPALRLPPQIGSAKWLPPTGMQFLECARTEFDDEGPVIYWTTWFLHTTRSRRTSESRLFRADSEQALWYQDLCNLWADVIEPGRALQVHFVHPEPPRNIGDPQPGHLLIVQGQDDSIPILTTALFDHATNRRQWHVAALMPPYFDVHQLYDLLGIARWCTLRPCPVVVGAHPHVAGDLLHVQDGEHVLTTIMPQPIQLPQDDSVSFMQAISEVLPSVSEAQTENGDQPHFQLNPWAPEFCPGVPIVAAMPDHIADLWALWQTTAFSWEQEDRFCVIMTWFVDHRWQFPHNPRGRRLQLRSDYVNWDSQMRQVWFDHIDPSATSELHLVSPNPPAGDIELAAHVIIIQQPRDDWITSLVTTQDNDQAAGPSFGQMAITTHEHLRPENVLIAAGLDRLCLGPESSHTWQMWISGHCLLPGHTFAGRSGHSITIRLQVLPSSASEETTSFLQLDRKVISLHLDSLLPTQTADLQHSCERPTTDAVAHAQWPQELHMSFPPIGTKIAEDWKCPDTHILVQVVHNAPHQLTNFVPDFIELPDIFTAEDAGSSLRQWGLACQIHLCGSHDAVFADFLSEDHTSGVDYLYCIDDAANPAGLIWHHSATPLDELAHMKFLHTKGFNKAVVLHIETWRPGLLCVHFADIQPTHATSLSNSSLRTPWPAPQPTRQSSSPPFPERNDLPPEAGCLLGLDLTELRHFLAAAQNLLWTDFEPFDLPECIKLELRQCQTVDHVDRLVIFTDGSSQARQRHQPPEWIADYDISDSWSFAVFAEQYSTDGSQPSRLQFLGWQCHQVLYETHAHHYIGTQKVGSDAAETEALFWAGLWRISQNHCIPTIFVSDSRLVGDQAAGRIGSTHADEPFRLLRAVFQTLTAILPHDLLRVSHVRSHTGDPFNELADWLAKTEGRSSHYLPRQPVNIQTFKKTLKHLWMAVKGQNDVPSLTQEGFDIGPIHLPPATSEPSSSTTSSSIAAPWSSMTFAISAGTANVRTFYRGEHGHSGKLDYVREQFIAHRLNFLGLQETRSDQSSSCQRQVLRLASGCENGHYGVELWVNLAQPYAWQGVRPVLFRRQDFVVVTATAKLLLVHVINQNLDLWLLVAHAPHSGIHTATTASWWTEVSELLHRFDASQQVILMLDANAATGPCDGVHVFAQDDVTSTHTHLLRDFLACHSLCLPATGPRHNGLQGTWIHPADQTEHRIDYVAIPCSWITSCDWSSCLETLDFGHLGDHRATAIQLQWQGFSTLPHRAQRKRSFDRTAIAHCDLSATLASYEPRPWLADIECHVDHFNDFVLTTLHETCPVPKEGPKKHFIPDSTWQLRTRKIQLQRRVRALHRVQRNEVLARLFGAWAGTVDEETFDLSFNYSTSLLVRRLSLGAALSQHAGHLRRLLARAKAQQLQEKIAELPLDCAASQILHTLKPIIGHTNPRMRKSSPLPQVLDDAGLPCATPQALLDRWIEFFGAMEGGERLPHAALRDQWVQSLRDFQQQELSLQPDDVPTLTDLEISFRRVRPRKAVGEDGIPPELCHQYPTVMARICFGQLLKLCTHGQEALVHKGGQLVAAWKHKGSQQQCASYRSLLISSHVAKTVHRAVRDHQATLYEAFLQTEQIGGRRAIPVSMGVHYVRAAARIAKRLGRSHALLFLDLREAFYRVIRPLAIGGCMPDALLALVAQRLQLPPDALSDLHHLLRAPSGLESADMPPHLRRAILALYTNTHFVMHGQTDRVHTRLGSRPGDPFADVVFGYMFARILKDVEDKLRAAGVLETLHDIPTPGLFATDWSLPSQPHTLLGPTWMDDLCITVSGTSAFEVEQKIAVAAPASSLSPVLVMA